MALLSTAARQALWRDIQTRLSAEREPVAVLKAELQQAINAADAWVDANAASFNAALPLAARQNLTPAQKARLLTFVLERRFRDGA